MKTEKRKNKGRKKKTGRRKNTGRKKKTERRKKTIRKKKARVHQETDFLNQGTHTLNRDSDFQEMDYWLNTCSLKDPGKMKNLEIPGCGELVHLDCYGGCLNIQKVINHFQSKRITWNSCSKCVLLHCEGNALRNSVTQCPLTEKLYIHFLSLCPSPWFFQR